MDKAEQLNSWLKAVKALYVAALVVDRAGQGLSDSDILSGVTTRKERAQLAIWLEEADSLFQTDTRRFTLPALLHGLNLQEFEQVQDLQAATNDDIIAEAERHLRGREPCPPSP